MKHRKRILAALLAAGMMTTTLPIALAAEDTPVTQAEDSRAQWQERAKEVEEAGLSVIWYPSCGYLARLYGTERMIVQGGGGLFALYGLDGRDYTGFIFGALEPSDAQGKLAACREGKWGLIDLNGGTVVKFTYQSAREIYQSAQARIVAGPSGGVFAVADLQGNLLTPYKYWNAHPFSYGYAAVQDSEGNWGYVDQTGTEVIPCQYHTGDVEDFGSDGFAIVDHLGFNVINVRGEALFPEEQYVKPWRAGLGLWGYVTEGKVGFGDGAGQVVIPPVYDDDLDPKGFRRGYVFDERTGLAQVRLGEERLYIDAQGNRAEAPTPLPEEDFKALHEGLYWVDAEGNSFGRGMGEGAPWGFADSEGALAVPTLFDAVGYFENGYALVKIEGVYGLLKNPLREDEISSWAREELDRARQAGLITPDCEAYRTYPITRKQFANLAVNFLERISGGAIDPAPKGTFSDTDDEGVRKAYAAGIVQGAGNGRFDPDGPLTREQLAAMLWRAMEQTGRKAPQTSLAVYTDGGQVSPWATEAVRALVGLRIMEGTGEGLLSPQATCTVEQAILLVARARGV